MDIIEDSYEEFSDTLLEIKLLYQQSRIRKYRGEPCQLPHNARRGKARTAGGAQAQGESLLNDWQERGMILVDADEYLNNRLEHLQAIRENLLKCMNRCSILAVRLYDIASYVTQKKK